MNTTNLNSFEQNPILIDEIMNFIPHRYPLLLIDRVLEIKNNDYIIGLKNVTINEPQFNGHFPGSPVMPGVMIVEAMAQLSAILVSHSLNERKNKIIYLMSIESSKFRQVVIPGDSLIIQTKINQQRSYVWRFSGFAKVDGHIVAESKFTAMVKDKI